MVILEHLIHECYMNTPSPFIKHYKCYFHSRALNIQDYLDICFDTKVKLILSYLANYVLDSIDSIFYFHKDDEITLYLGQLELYDA